MRINLWALLAFTFVGCSLAKPKYTFDEKRIPTRPNYEEEKNWASLPFIQDPADLTPSADYINVQDSALADVFFLHPTTYIGARGENKWNASVQDHGLNKKTDKSTILYQASIFNGSGRIFAPRYRQAHLHSYFSKDDESKKKAINLAYKDVSSAFEYYLENYHKGRPIILAAHSQGTTHAIRLLKEFFVEKPLKKKLVVAYLVGMPVSKGTFLDIPHCQEQFDTECFCSWRTIKRGYEPKKMPTGPSLAVNNPLSWTVEDIYAPKALNIGGIARKFEGGIIPGINDAQIHDGLLWASKPKFPGSVLLSRKNYHIGDFNLFYSNVRQNARERVISYLQNKEMSLSK